MPRTKCFCEKEVLEKAVDLFWKKGFHATSMQDLVDHLGINRASLYSTYGDKKALFKAALKHYQQANGERLQHFFEEQKSVKEGLKNFFEQNIDDATSSKERIGCFMVNTTTELLPGEPEFADLLKQNKVNFEKLLANFIAKGVDSGELPAKTDTKALASYLFTLQNGIQVVAKLDPSKAKLKQMAQQGLSALPA